MNDLKEFIKDDINKTFDESVDDVMFAVQFYNSKIKEIDPILYNCLIKHLLICGEQIQKYKEFEEKYNSLKKHSKGLVMAIESDMEMNIPGVSDLTTTHMGRVKKDLKDA